MKFKILVRAILALVGLSAVFSVCAQTADDCIPKSVDVCRLAKTISNELSGDLPMQLNSNLSLQTSSASGRTVSIMALLNYTRSFLDQNLATSGVSDDEMVQVLRNLASSGFCEASSQSRYFLEQGGNIAILYRFVDGTAYTNVHVTSNSCSSAQDESLESKTESPRSKTLDQTDRDQAAAFDAPVQPNQPEGAPKETSPEEPLNYLDHANKWEAGRTIKEVERLRTIGSRPFTREMIERELLRQDQEREKIKILQGIGPVQMIFMIFLTTLADPIRWLISIFCAWLVPSHIGAIVTSIISVTTIMLIISSSQSPQNLLIGAIVSGAITSIFFLLRRKLRNKKLQREVNG